MNVKLGWRLFSLLCMSTIMIVGLLLTASYAVISSWNVNKDFIVTYLVETDKNVTKEIQTSLFPLSEKFRGDECTADVLREMQIAQFQSNYFQEFGFLSNGDLICSSSLGLLEKPMPQSKIDIIGDVSFSKQSPILLLANNSSAMTIKVGNFQAFFRPFVQPYTEHNWINVDVYIYSGASFHLATGSGVLIPQFTSPKAPSLSQLNTSYWTFEECYSKNVCALISINIIEYFQTKLVMTIIFFILFILVLLSAIVAFWQMQRRYYSINRQVKRGINLQQIQCYYQPIMDIKSEKMFGCEVLCRWNNSEGELIFPDEFIKEVVRNDQEKELTRIVIEKSIIELSKYKLLGDIQVSINAFPTDISSGHIYSVLDKYLDKQYLSTVTIEITEEQVEDMGLIAEKIDQLRSIGIKVSIDDFGTGYSNLQHVKELNIDCLKIDKSFVFAMDDHAIKGSLVKHITDLAHVLNVSVVAEGVETKTQLTELKKLGVTYSQGYLHSKAVSIAEFHKFYLLHR